MNNNDSMKNIVLCVEIKKKKKQKEYPMVVPLKDQTFF